MVDDPGDRDDADEGPAALSRCFYRLELRLEPGGRRKWDIHLLSDLADVEAALRDDLASDPEAALVFEEALELRVCAPERVGPVIDLRPCVGITLPGYPELTLEPDGAVVGADDIDPDDWDALAEGRLRPLAVRVDLSRAAVPPLSDPRLAPGEFVDVEIDGELRRLPHGRTAFE